MLRCYRPAFELVKEPLHSGFFTRRGVLLDYAFAGRGIDLFDHIHKGGFRLIRIFFLGKSHKFFGARPDRAFYRFVADTPLFALPVPLFGGTYLACQMKTPLLIFPFTGLVGSFIRTLFKIRRTPFFTLALVAFRDILYLAVFEKGFHLDFAAAGTKEFLGGS
jgi:hypothetical protein